jgi:nucleotide-binding universal stress UspA family protein
MQIKNIAVFLDAGSPCASRVGLAVSLAVLHGAQLTAFCVCRLPPMDPADGYAIGLRAISDVLTHWDAGLAQSIAPTEAAFRAASLAAGVDHRWIVCDPGQTPHELAVRARCFDLVIAAGLGGQDKEDQALAEWISLASGTPSLFAPAKFAASPPFERIVAAWDGGRAAKRALQDGLPFLKQARSVQLVIVSADGDPPEEVGAEAILRHLASHDVKAAVNRAPPSREGVAETLLHQCVQADADLLVMGAYGHSRASEMLLGGVTRTVLAQAQLPVFMSH